MTKQELARWKRRSRAWDRLPKPKFTRVAGKRCPKCGSRDVSKSTPPGFWEFWCDDCEHAWNENE
ncbi:MAG: hypothetical protein AB7K24_04010 [Gemmataceae bacterium]